MSDPVLHVLAGPNGAGKSTLYEKVIQPATGLRFVNADVIAAQRWPGDAGDRSYEAAALAEELRSRLMAGGASFVTETVFSHESKIDLVRAALDARYLVSLHIVTVPEHLAVARVASRVLAGGHSVPEEKIRQRYKRLWPLVASAISLVDAAWIYDNASARRPFRLVARFERGSLVGEADWPTWTPPALLGAATHEL